MDFRTCHIELIRNLLRLVIRLSYPFTGSDGDELRSTRLRHPLTRSGLD